MRLALALCLVFLLALTGSASAASGKRTEKSPAEIGAYWTKERVNNAIPREPRPMGKPGGSAGGGFTSAAVPTPYTGDMLNNGKVFFTLGGSNYVCSGTSVQSPTNPDESLVWTAGHCLNEGPGAYATNFMFAPGYLNGTYPHGRWASTALATTTQWRTAGSFTYDVGIARVAPVPGSTAHDSLSDVATPRPMTFGYGVTVGTTRFTSYGYPAAGKFNGQRMHMCDSAVTRRDGTADEAPMGIGCNMTGGSSGGGWILAGITPGAVGSVNSYGRTGIKNTMFGPFQGAVAQALYNSTF